MDPLSKLKKIRAGHRSHVTKLVEKADGLQHDDIDGIKVLIATLKRKVEVLEKCDANIMELVTDEDGITKEIEDTSQYSDLILNTLTRLEISVEHFNRKMLEAMKVERKVDASAVVVPKTENRIRLPKITIKEYDGSVLQWTSFWDQFEAAVHSVSDLSEIQKFTYLKSFLIGDAEKAIKGLTLSKENYDNAVETLKLRFGNKQARIAAHMKELRLMKHVNKLSDVAGLRLLYDTLELNITNLKELKIDVATYGSLLIAIIFDRIPEELRIKISLKFGDNEWKLDDTLKVIKSELEARERSLAMSGNKNIVDEEYFSTHSLQLAAAKENRNGKSGKINNKTSQIKNVGEGTIARVSCVFCRGEHLSSRCKNVTNIQARWNIVRKERLCFVCLKKNHTSQSCWLKYSCWKCKQKHNIALCKEVESSSDSSSLHRNPNKDGYKREKETKVTLVESETADDYHLNEISEVNTVVSTSEIVLQCAMATVCNTNESVSYETCVLFDLGSHRSYITEKLRKRLGLVPIRKETLLLKRFGSSEGVVKCLDVVQVCLQGKDGYNIYMDVLCCPYICSRIQVPRNVIDSSYEISNKNGIELAVSPTNSEVEILIGIDFYYTFVSGNIIKGSCGTLVETIFGWIISGATGTDTKANVVATNFVSSLNLSISPVGNGGVKVSHNDCNILDKKMPSFEEFDSKSVRFMNNNNSEEFDSKSVRFMNNINNNKFENGLDDIRMVTNVDVDMNSDLKPKIIEKSHSFSEVDVKSAQVLSVMNNKPDFGVEEFSSTRSGVGINIVADKLIDKSSSLDELKSNEVKKKSYVEEDAELKSNEVKKKSYVDVDPELKSNEVKKKSYVDEDAELKSNEVKRKSYVDEDADLMSELKRFWEIEEVSAFVEVEDEVLEYFEKSIYFNGFRYVVSLPFKKEVEFVPDNFKISYCRLRGLLNKLNRNTALKHEYEEIIKSYVDEGIVEKVKDNGVPGRVHYLPHRAVIREDKETTKVRIVFDGSAKEKNGISINECLFAGPCLLGSIFDILIRFGFGKIGIIADIKQAFLQLEIKEEHKDFLRFIYCDENDPSKIQRYRFNRGIFGVTCIPFLLNATIRYHMKKKLKNTEQIDMVNKFLESIYVDDVTTAVDDVSEGTSFVEFAKLSMKEAGLDLTKWYSNDRDLQRLFGYDGEVETKKVLGILWNKDDDLVFDIGHIARAGLNLPLTKRNILSVGASFYDPVGLISPLVMVAKIFFQEICRDKISWDAVLTNELAKRWIKYLNELDDMKKVEVPRYLFKGYEVDGESVILHGFCDSSEQAYCAAIYVQDSKNVEATRLITAKTKVTPIKKLSIPRLELMSCLLMSELLVRILEALKGVVEVEEVNLWNDSEVALAWIKGEDKRWKPWVQNRVDKIVTLTQRNNWRHVNTDDNPADLATRRKGVIKLMNCELWWYGPKFIRENWKATYNMGERLCDMKETVVEVDSFSMVVSTCDSTGLGNLIDLDRFSDLMKLLRTTCYIFRFVNNCRKVKQILSGVITGKEMDLALERWIKNEQKIMMGKKDKFKNMIKQLQLFEGKDGLFRLTGRLANSKLDLAAKHPILLHKDSKLTELVILQAHQKVKHMRTKSTLNEVRSQYWIPKGKQTVRKIIKDCVICKYVIGRPMKGPISPNLPEYRVAYDFAFTSVGLDFAGPLYVKDVYSNTNSFNKASICLFTCAATRGVHIELCPNMSTGCLIRCMKRFIARKGKCSLVISDNFQTFVSEELKYFLLSEEIKWNHILAKSPWWGAFYERLIRIIKEALKKCVGKASLDYEELETVLAEIEMVINSRPLTYLYEDGEEEALTPAHMFTGRRLLSATKETKHNHELSQENMSNRYKYLQTVIQHYWNRFVKEYLFELHEHHLYTRSKGNYDEYCRLLLGDVVLIKDDSMKRNSWKKGRVEKLIRGNDGKVRGAVLKVCTDGRISFLERPLQKIIPLEVKKEDNLEFCDINKMNSSITADNEHSEDQNNVNSTKRKRNPPSRYQVQW